MGFQEILQDMVEKSGGVAGTVMGKDGIAIQNYVKKGRSCDIEGIGVEFGKVLEDVIKVAETLQMGEVEEMSVSYVSSKLLIRLIKHDYFAVVALDSSGFTGKAKYELKKAVSRLIEEF